MSLAQAIATSELTEAFWLEQGSNLESMLVRVLMDIVEAGAVSKLGSDYNVYRRRLEEDRRKWFLVWLLRFFSPDGDMSIIRTSRERVDQVGVEQAIVWIGSVQRADDIAITETTRMYNWGVLRGKEYLGEDTKTWYTMEDELVCEICGPMHGVTIPISEPFVLITGEELDTPPAHSRGRCECQ